jgi:hypothetical protein
VLQQLVEVWNSWEFEHWWFPVNIYYGLKYDR